MCPSQHHAHGQHTWLNPSPPQVWRTLLGAQKDCSQDRGVPGQTQLNPSPTTAGQDIRAPCCAQRCCSSTHFSVRQQQLCEVGASSGQGSNLPMMHVAAWRLRGPYQGLCGPTHCQSEGPHLGLCVAKRQLCVNDWRPVRDPQSPLRSTLGHSTPRSTSSTRRA